VSVSGQRQLEGHEDLGHLLAELGHGLRARAVLGVGLLELLVEGGHRFHATGDFEGIRTGRRGFLGGAIGLDFLFFLGFGGVLVDLGNRDFLGRFLDVVEAGDDFRQALLARLVQVVFLQQQLDRPREARQCREHLVEAFLDALGDGDFAFARKQFDRAHLAHVHAHGVGRAGRLRNPARSVPRRLLRQRCRRLRGRRRSSRRAAAFRHRVRLRALRCPCR
jgi:hypothetical protein